MASSIGGYRSPVDLGIGTVPLTTEPEVFNQMVEVYNALHLLNQYLDQLRIIAEGGGSGQTPEQSMPFNRFYVAKALQVIDIGTPISPSNITGQNGMVNGALANQFTGPSPTSNFCGLALTAAVVGEDVRVGVGPGSVSMAGTLSGNVIYAYSARATNGNLFGESGLYIGNPGVKTNATGTAYPMPVAICIRDGFIMFGQYLAL
ncbi:hypothetical protein [Edaphovirga cremea]|uniref:hypothetical protein n=1 Tax=Edaphovirga cremea TaxID=2267246 RepID=UPI0039893799